MARLTGAALALGSLAFATLVTYVLKTWADIDNPSSVYLLAVAGVAFANGTVAAVATAIGSFVLYNFLFVEPRFSLAVAEPQSVLTLLLLLLVGVIVGRLTSLGRDRAAQAARREREARAGNITLDGGRARCRGGASRGRERGRPSLDRARTDDGT